MRTGVVSTRIISRQPNQHTKKNGRECQHSVAVYISMICCSQPASPACTMFSDTTTTCHVRLLHCTTYTPEQYAHIGPHSPLLVTSMSCVFYPPDISVDRAPYPLSLRSAVYTATSLQLFTTCPTTVTPFLYLPVCIHIHVPYTSHTASKQRATKNRLNSQAKSNLPLSLCVRASVLV